MELALRTALVVVTVVASAGCDWLDDRLKTCNDIRVDLVNSEQTLGAVNIAGPEEGFTPETLLASGASRRIGLCVERGDRKKFRAAKDGQVLGVANCVVGQASYEASIPRVVWTLQGFLCQGW